MLTGISKTQIENLYYNIDAFMLYLNTINEHFVLTGSQFFGGSTNESDYDFFVVKTPRLEYFLKRDFYIISINDNKVNSFYLGTNLTIYEKTLNDDTKVQVQVLDSQKDFELKQKVQLWLLDNVKMQNLSKQERKLVWSVTLKLLSK